MESHEEIPRQSITISNRWGLTALVLVLVLCATAGVSLFYFVREHRQARDLAATNQALSANLGQMQSQMQALSEKFNALTAVSQAAAPTRSMSTSSSSSKPPAMTKRVRARAATHQLDDGARSSPARELRHDCRSQTCSSRTHGCLSATRRARRRARDGRSGGW